MDEWSISPSIMNREDTEERFLVPLLLVYNCSFGVFLLELDIIQSSRRVSVDIHGLFFQTQSLANSVLRKPP